MSSDTQQIVTKAWNFAHVLLSESVAAAFFFRPLCIAGWGAQSLPAAAGRLACLAHYRGGREVLVAAHAGEVLILVGLLVQPVR